MLESIKHKSKKSFYPQKIIACKDNTKNTWNVWKELVGKTLEIRASFTRKTFD